MSIRELLEQHPVLDGHNDLLWAARTLADYDFDRLDLLDADCGRSMGTHTDIPRARAGGLGAQFWSVWVPASLVGDAAVTATLEQIDAAHQMIERYDDFAFARTVADVENAWHNGRIASLMGAEGGHQINESLGVLRMLHQLGVRYLTLTHNDNVPWADSATDEPVLNGLNDCGREVIAEMNRIGMMVDLSHVSADVMRQALDVSTRPVLFSHSSARAVCDHPRNVPDDVLTRLPDNGGVCMVTFVPHFVTPAVREWVQEAETAGLAEGLKPHQIGPEVDAFLRRYSETHPRPSSSVADVVTHLNHVREVAGIDHVGLGGDYDGVDRLPEGLEDVSGYPRLLEALAEAGWSATDLAKLTCRNALRVLDANPVASAEEAVI